MRAVHRVRMSCIASVGGVRGVGGMRRRRWRVFHNYVFAGASYNGPPVPAASIS